MAEAGRVKSLRDRDERTREMERDEKRAQGETGREDERGRQRIKKRGAEEERGVVGTE